MSQDNTSANEQYLANVLTVTRDQLNRAMGACAELEALLTAERSNTAALQQTVAELQAALEAAQQPAATAKNADK